MEKHIPYVFDDVVIYKPLSPTSFSNVGRTRVRTFYLGANKNGSFITPQVAEYLIQTAPTKPVVGFYNYLKEDFEGHSSPELAKGYGYIPETPNFAWEKHLDKDGVEREYACFDVVLHVDYWEEAKQIIGKAQSMELNTDTIRGDWTIIDGKEVFVYTFAEMKGFCVLGDDKEPCFEGASFEKETRFEKFSLLLSDLMEKVKEAEKEGGEQEMIFNTSVINHEDYESLFNLLNPDYNEEHNFEVKDYIYSVNDGVVKTFQGDHFCEYSYTKDDEGKISIQENAPEVFCASVKEYNEMKEEYEKIQNDYSVLQDSFENNKTIMEDKTTEFEVKIGELTTKIDELTNALQNANEKINTYEAQFAEIENAKKNDLVSSYESVLAEEDITPIKENVSNFSYDELESKLAVAFSRKAIQGKEKERIPVVDHSNEPASQFAKLIEKYRK